MKKREFITRSKKLGLKTPSLNFSKTTSFPLQIGNNNNNPLELHPHNPHHNINNNPLELHMCVIIKR